MAAAWATWTFSPTASKVEKGPEFAPALLLLALAPTGGEGRESARQLALSRVRGQNPPTLKLIRTQNFRLPPATASAAAAEAAPSAAAETTASAPSKSATAFETAAAIKAAAIKAVP